MPYIYQLKPGVKPVTKSAPKYTLDDKPRAISIENDMDVRGVSYTGYGDFLTVVTHRADVKAEKTEFGAIISESEYVFNANCINKFDENNIKFLGKIGFLRRREKGFEMCNIDAVYIGVGDVILERVNGIGAISLVSKDSAFLGVAEDDVCIRLYGVDKNLKFYNNGKARAFKTNDEYIELEISAGQYEIRDGLATPEKIKKVNISEHRNGIEIGFEKAEQATHYEIAYGTSYNELNVITVNKNSALIDAEKGKYYIKVRAINFDRKGEWSEVYTAYVTHKIPRKVKGFRIKAHNNGLEFSWGMQHGASIYRLYKTNKNFEDECIYEGADNCFFLNCCIEAEFYVVCSNGYGDSEKSVIRSSAKEGQAYFDPYPEKSFLRDTIINHHGYGGFDYAYNEKRSILEYPD